MEPKRILFFVPEWPAGSSGIAHSRVLSMARLMVELGHECLYMGCDESITQAKEAEVKIKEDYGVNAWVAPLFTAGLGYWGLSRIAKKLMHATRHVIQDFRPTHIYSQSLIGARHARQLASQTGALSVFDVQGALAEEVAMRRTKLSPRYWYIRWLERVEFRYVDRLGCVSHKMRDYIGRLVGRNDSIVIPSCFDERKFHFDMLARQTIRHEQKWVDEHQVIVYCGGLSVWQRVADIISLFEAIAQRDEGFRFLFVTPDRAALNRLLEKSSLAQGYFAVVSCPQTEVYRYLSTADVGIIMRHDVVVNNVASPIKVGEYLGCGLPLILTRGIGDYSDSIPSAGLGILLDETQDIAEQVIRFLEEVSGEPMRERAVQYSTEQLAVRASTGQYLKLFA